MRVSIITAVHNGRETIEGCLNSIYNQRYANVEHIIIDGGSTDGTLEIIDKYQEQYEAKVSEKDNGIYHALNKGIDMATGDVIGFLHADDFYAHNEVIEKVVYNIKEHKVDCCYSDLVYVSRINTERIIRYWKSCPYEQSLLAKGWMPPHPTLFVRKKIYDRYGSFNTDLKIAADYELVLRLLKNCKISTCYIPEVLVKMSIGGASNRSITNIISKSYEDYKACKLHKMRHSLYTVILKNLSKVPQFF